LVSPPIASSELPTFQPIPINLVSCTLVTPAELTELAELEERELALDELLQLGGPYKAQYSGFQVSQGQSGQLFPCGQLNDELLEERLEEILERMLDELSEILDELDGTHAPPVTPKGDGWLVQVAREIQLLLFS
tara:strand:+ start:128 stop:532 length:405 start_codon:yes stop_codon:yes gene_type:complete